MEPVAENGTHTNGVGAQQQPMNAAEIERQQEELLMRKYGGLKPRKKGSAATKEHKFFDSADWALAKQGVKTADVLAQGAPVAGLEPKLEPTALPPRRVSHLGGEGDL